MPFLSLLVVVLGGTLVAVMRRLVLAMSASVRALDAAFRTRAGRVAHHLRLDEVSVLAPCALLIAAATVGAVWWYYSPLLVALVTNVSTGATDRLALLAPTFVEYHNQYRQVLIVAVMVTVVVWYPVLRLIKRGQSLHWGFMAGGILSVCVAMALLHFPYRLLYFNKAFEAVEWNGNRCYVTGEQPTQVLLFCPELEPPRNRVSAANEPGLSKLGVRESIFSRYSNAVR
jgi:hypothetical protein